MASAPRRSPVRAWLGKVCVTTGTSPEGLTATQYPNARAAVHDTVITQRGYRPKMLSTPLLRLEAVMYHRGQAAAPTSDAAGPTGPSTRSAGTTSQPRCHDKQSACEMPRLERSVRSPCSSYCSQPRPDDRAARTVRRHALGITVGIDWAEGHHDIAIMDAGGKVVAKARIDTGIEGFTTVLRMIAEQGGTGEDTPIGIQTDKNLLVVALLDAGFTVYPLNPRAVAR